MLSASLISRRRRAGAERGAGDRRGRGELLKAIDRLSAKLRERIGESLATIRANPALDQVTTASLPALRKYSRGAPARGSGPVRRRRFRCCEEAVALDTGFAMACRKLAVTLGNTGGRTPRQIAAATRAFPHRDRLPELERDLAVGVLSRLRQDYEPAKVIAAYRSALAIDPDNLVSLNNLAVQFAHAAAVGEAESRHSRREDRPRGFCSITISISLR